ncbi:flavin reductase family protein [Streptomyces sp. NPDC052101]|uniref:flavin reductase family protein n=1 Tax=Streptomyces sp. NPDC052101 TaxID=3155763 RepID=UPI00343ABB53
MSVRPAEFREALARLAAHVSIVTGYDRDGRPRGFTASAVCSLSADPPLILVCIARKAPSHEVFIRSSSFAVNVLRDSHQYLAERFATAGVDRFAGADFVTGPHAPHLPDALCTLTCSTYETHPGGDHSILVGRVEQVTTSNGEPLVYFHRRFCGLALAPTI